MRMVIQNLVSKTHFLNCHERDKAYALSRLYQIFEVLVCGKAASYEVIIQDKQFCFYCNIEAIGCDVIVLLSCHVNSG